MKKLDNIKKTGFKVPNNYFSNIEDRIMDEIKFESTLQNSKESGFVIPDSYLDDLEGTILNKLPKQETKIVSLFNKRNITYISGIAAAILILFAVFVNSETSFNIDNLDDELVENYILETDIDTYELAALLTEEEITTIDAEIFGDTFTDNSLEDYLLENVDLEDIMDQ